MKKAAIEKQFNKVQNLARKHLDESNKFDAMIQEYYGEEHYSAHDLDGVIDSLNYGYGSIRFNSFDKQMKKINQKGNK